MTQDMTKTPDQKEAPHGSTCSPFSCQHSKSPRFLDGDQKKPGESLLTFWKERRTNTGHTDFTEEKREASRTARAHAGIRSRANGETGAGMRQERWAGAG